MDYLLNDNEILNSLLINNKDRFIKKIDWNGSSFTEQEVLDFFKSHANLENKIDWNKSVDEQKAQIINLIDETKTNKENKTDIKNLFKSNEFRIVGEDDNFVYVAPLTWEACKFIDSYQCGGQGATWCIGWEKSDEYWSQYVDDGYVFVLMMSKNKNTSPITALEPMYETTYEEDEFYDEELNDYFYEEIEVTKLNGHDIDYYDAGNKVMLQIDGNNVTAWEQSDDFPLFEDEDLPTVIGKCNLGLNFDYDDWSQLSDELQEIIEIEKERREQAEREADEKILNYDDGTKTAYIDLTSAKEYEKYVDINSYRSFLRDSGCENLVFKGKWDENIHFHLVRGWGYESMDLSGVDFGNEVVGNLFNFRRTHKLDISSLQPRNLDECDGLFTGAIIREVTVNPNFTELIQYLQNYKEEHNYDLKIITRGHNEEQGNLELEFEDGSVLEPSYDYYEEV